MKEEVPVEILKAKPKVMVLRQILSIVWQPTTMLLLLHPVQKATRIFTSKVRWCLLRNSMEPSMEMLHSTSLMMAQQVDNSMCSVPCISEM